MQPTEEYLVEYLQEEFSRFPKIRIHVKKEEGELGVMVRSESREWFFPFAWSSGEGFKRVHRQVGMIRELME